MMNEQKIKELFPFSDRYNSKYTYEIIEKVFHRKWLSSILMRQKTYSKFYIKRTIETPVYKQNLWRSYLNRYENNYYDYWFSPLLDDRYLALWDDSHELEQILIRAKILSENSNDTESTETIVFSTKYFDSIF